MVANNYNDSISVIDTATGTVRYEHDLRPFVAGNEGVNGGVGGTFPFAVVVKGNGTAYVSSDRNREVVVIDISSPTAGQLIKRIKLDGNALGMTLDPSGSQLFVGAGQRRPGRGDRHRPQRGGAKIDARAPAGMLPGSIAKDRDRDDDGDRFDRDHRRARYTGAATFAVTLAPDGRTLYAVNAGANSVAVIPAARRARLPGQRPDPDRLRAARHHLQRRRSVDVHRQRQERHRPEPRPPGQRHRAHHRASRTRAATPPPPPPRGPRTSISSSWSAPRWSAPRCRAVGARASDEKVAENNFYDEEVAGDEHRVMKFLRDHIKHVIYIVKENRTFDQILGDLGNGANGDSSLTQFGESLTPNFHRLARQFVTLDNFMDPGDGSMDGWSWSLAGPRHQHRNHHPADQLRLRQPRPVLRVRGRRTATCR